MICPNCAHQNAAAARFCENCGQPLLRRCPNCGQEAAPAARFCNNCGHSLDRVSSPLAPPALSAVQATAPAALQQQIRSLRGHTAGERKLVTALFADIVASTELAEHMDPEDWREVVSGAHMRVGEAVHRYDGYVAQLLGDGVLAFFGAPLSHEDDAERAVRAALAILASTRAYATEPSGRSLLRALQMRIGLNTGMVVVGDIGSDLRMEYLAIGDTVNLAARMQSAAEPDSILISDQTRRLLGELFELEDRGLISVKGKGEPVHVYRVLDERKGARRMRGIQGVSSPMVGRQREFRALQQLAGELNAGRGGIVSIVGEAGLGKSRLISEWRRSMVEEASEGPSFCWAEAHCMSHGVGVVYQLMSDVLRSILEVSPGATAPAIEAALRASCDDLLGEAAGDVYPFLGHILGLPMEDEAAALVKHLDALALQARYVSALRKYLAARAARCPVIVVADDIQWCDPSSVELMAGLLSLAAEVALLFVFATRPEREADGWRLVSAAREVPGASALELHLTPLTQSDSRQLIGNLLEASLLPEWVRALILEKSEGNPLFTEEVIRMLIDRGVLRRQGEHWEASEAVPDEGIPDTLQGVIMERVDRLPDSARRTLQTAAVIGRRFRVRVLETVSQDVPKSTLVEHLVLGRTAELVRPAQQGDEYWFKHVLIQEAIYGSLLKSVRANLHLRTAEAVEALVREAPGEYAGLLAYHFERAGRIERAFAYAVQAGERARAMHAYRAAIESYDSALALAARLPDRSASPALAAVHRDRGQVLQSLSDHEGARHSFQAMLQVARELGDVGLQADAMIRLVTVQILLDGLTPEVEQNLREALALAEACGQPALRGRAYWNMGLAYRFHDPQRSFPYFEQAAALAMSHAETDPQMRELAGYALTDLGVAKWVSGRVRETRALMEESAQIFRALDNRSMLANSLGGLASLHFFIGEPEVARRYSTEGLELSLALSSPWGIAYSSWGLLCVSIDAGQFEQAQAIGARALECARSVHFPAFVGMIGSEMARLELESGRPERALPLGAEAEHGFEQMGAPNWEAYRRVLSALRMLLQGDLQRAWETVRPLTENGDERQKDLEALIIGAPIVAQIGLRAGRHHEALSFCNWLLPVLEREGVRRYIGELLLWRSRLYLAVDDPVSALDDLGRAAEVLAHTEVHIVSWQIEATRAKVHAAHGDVEQARNAQARAAALLRRIAGAITAPALRASFLARPDVAETLARAQTEEFSNAP